MRPLRILITAGPTVEPIDPVRYISNYSTGIMGYELARLARKRKYSVTLISGPTCLEPPDAVRLVRIKTANQLREKVNKELKNADALIMASAVCDYRPVSFFVSKIKEKKRFVLKLARNPDILGSIPSKLRKGKIIAGFALESDDLLNNAALKLKKKDMDFIVANEVTKKSTPFGPGRKKAYIMDRKGHTKKLCNATKGRIASAILDTIDRLCYTSR